MRMLSPGAILDDSFHVITLHLEFLFRLFLFLFGVELFLVDAAANRSSLTSSSFLRVSLWWRGFSFSSSSGCSRCTTASEHLRELERAFILVLFSSFDVSGISLCHQFEVLETLSQHVETIKQKTLIFEHASQKESGSEQETEDLTTSICVTHLFLSVDTEKATLVVFGDSRILVDLFKSVSELFNSLRLSIDFTHLEFFYFSVNAANFFDELEVA